jgi:hypothetical protein
MYIFLKNCEIIECHSLLEVASYFDINISEKGIVTIDGQQDTISYNMKNYTKEKAYKDFVATRLSRFKTFYKGELM